MIVRLRGAVRKHLARCGFTWTGTYVMNIYDLQDD